MSYETIGEDTKKEKELVDIRDIKVDKFLPREERLKEYIRQIKDPFQFKCGKFTVTTSYSDTELTVEDCMVGIIS